MSAVRSKMVKVGTVSVLVEASQRGGKKFAAHHETVLESWSPNFDGDIVQVSLIPLINGDWRVCVWGADDTGMEFDSSHKDLVEARFEAIGDGITRAELKARGFVPA